MRITFWGSLALLSFSYAVWAQTPTQRSVVKGPLSLEEAVNVALRESPLVKGQTAEVAAAQARLRQAVARTRLIASTTTHLTTGDAQKMIVGPSTVMPMDMEMMGPKASFNQDVSLFFPLYTGGRLQSRVKAARSLFESAQADKETLRQEVRLQTRVAYRRVLWVQSVVDIYKDSVTAAEERLRVDRDLYEAGKVARVNVFRNEADLANQQQQLTNARRDLATAMVDLRTVMGIDAKSDFTLTQKLEAETLTPDENAVLQRAYTSRPELKAVGLRALSAESQIRAARSAYKPQVNAIASGDLRAQRETASERDAIVGVVASLPLLDGGMRRAEVNEAKADLQKTQQDAEQLKLMVTREVQTALLELAAATQNITTAQAAVKSAEEDYRLAQLRYSTGKGINLEPLDALAALTRARTNLVEALFQQQVAIDTLERATGAPLRKRAG